MTQAEFQEMQQAWNEFQVAAGEVSAAKAAGRTPDPIVTERLERLSAALDGYEGLAAKSIGAAAEYHGRADAPRSEAMKMFGDVLRGKKVPEEQLLAKALITGDDTRGGYLAPLEFVAEIIRSEVEWSPIRNIARIRSTTRVGVQIPKRTTTAAASWVSETGARTETTNPSFGMEEIRTHELYAMCKVSKQEVEDSAFDIEGFLRDEFGEQFGLSEGSAFVGGNGIGRPEGLLTNADVGLVLNGHASELQADALIALLYEPKETYINSGTFLMSRPTLRIVRTLKDGTGAYLWSPGLKSEGRPSSILDRPYVVCPDLPNVGAGTFPILFGDFRRGYTIVDRIAIEVMTDPYKSKETGMVEFSARRRVGGQVVLPEAIKKLKIATS